MNAIRVVDRLVGVVISLASWLVLPVSLLLFLQWPLREFLHAGSREANDLGQVLFALYMAVAVTAATRARRHLAIDTLARRYGQRTRAALTRAAILAGLIPWALFVLYAGRNYFVNSILQLERFGDTLNPGYFLVKTAIALLALLMLAQGLLNLLSPGRATGAAGRE